MTANAHLQRVLRNLLCSMDFVSRHPAPEGDTTEARRMAEVSQQLGLAWEFLALQCKHRDAWRAARRVWFACQTCGLIRRVKEQWLFRLLLGFAIVDAPSLAGWKEAPLVLVAGGPRAVVSSTNDMKRHLGWSTNAPAWASVQTNEDFINRLPFGALGMGFPDQKFARRLGEGRER